MKTIMSITSKSFNINNVDKLNDVNLPHDTLAMIILEGDIEQNSEVSKENEMKNIRINYWFKCPLYDGVVESIVHRSPIALIQHEESKWNEHDYKMDAIQHAMICICGRGMDVVHESFINPEYLEKIKKS